MPSLSALLDTFKKHRHLTDVIAEPVQEIGEGRGKVLLVEDYAPNVMVATLMLESLGFTVVVASNGMEAVRIVSERNKPFAAILMDVQMQEMDGMEATQHIRELEVYKDYRQTIIGVTAHALAGDRERCISAGMDDYISKPIHPDILAERMNALAASI